MVTRGKLKVFLGAAPGVGKTCALLEQGQRLKSEGKDVVIGFVESHGRADTEAMLAGLELVPRRIVKVWGVAHEEMDVEALLERRPEVALVDELGHSNAPGSVHAKRWQDVEALLDSGIGVISTVDIHNLDSLNDVIFEITAVAQRETIPDEVVRRADEIELVDLTQEAVRERLAAGKIYPAERVDAALANYFRAGNLGALRELALSWTADRVDEAVARYRHLHGIDQPWETRERVVVALAGAEGGETVVRRAARLAMRSRAELVGVYVRPTRAPAESVHLPAQRRLLVQLGGRYHEVVGDDVGASLLAFARDENATQIVLGATRRSRFEELIRGSPTARVIRSADDVDIHVVSYQGGPRRKVARPRRRAFSPTRVAVSWAMIAIGLPVITWLLLELGGALQLQNVLFIYLLVAVVTGGIGGALPAVIAALAGFLLSNWFFTPPAGTWSIADPDDLLSLFAFLGVSLTVGLLVGHSSRRSSDAQRARTQAEALAATTTTSPPISAADHHAWLRRIRDAFSLEAVSMIRLAAEGWETVAWEGSHELGTPGDGTGSIALTEEVTLVILGGRLTADDRTILRAIAVQMTQAIERAGLEREARSAETMIEADRLRTALLRAVSHDLRTPLATIKASLTSLVETGVEWTGEEARRFLETALGETERLDRLVGHLLDAGRLQAGAVHVFYRSVGLDEVVGSALSGLRSATGRVNAEISESLPEVQTDPDLLERVIANLVENALTWSPATQSVSIRAGRVSGRIHLRIIDRGPGIPAEAHQLVVQPFQRMGDSPNRQGVGLGLAVAKGLLDAMGNELVIEDTPGGGTTMVIALKITDIVEVPIAEGAELAHR